MGTSGPKYQRIKDELRAEVARDEYEAGAPFITQNQLRERFQVSSTTAVRALNDLVAEGLLVRRRGQGTFVADPGDRAAAKPSPAYRSGVIACVISGQGPYQSEVLRGIESGCSERGMRLFFADSAVHMTETGHAAHDASLARQDQALRQAVEDRVDGIILYPVQGAPDPGVLDGIRRLRIPMVLVDRYFPGLAIDAVTADNYDVGYRLTEHLLADGHERIATLWGETQCTSVHDRMTGHKQALRAHDQPLLPQLTALRSYTALSEDERKQLLTDLLGSPEPPTALLCAHGFAVATAAADLASLGIAVPDEIVLAGMDDAGPYDLLPLTSFAARLPAREIGLRAVEQLVTRIAERTAGEDPYRSAEQIVLPVRIRTRESVSVRLRTVAARRP
ncbi:GntR family transcriptional regulator [Streptomyces sp. NBC_00893]|uniref:GntR family transcriptional regulator n=1 Tax=Streptomyces sp. NBC_00893 TaxID=2975862 RepID=UPI002252E016|nr:GntR family transcriptional regulator [Streptomyces sp. NBC_00893]MCX4849964.1 GntR family transcriptional regulator [Streptomyces sp. NBC_00893]